VLSNSLSFTLTHSCTRSPLPSSLCAHALSLTICELQQPLIGICPAKAILGTDSILWRQTEDKTHPHPAIESSAIQAGLDHNHSHFILVEDEVGTGFGAENALRGEFEKFLGTLAFVSREGATQENEEKDAKKENEKKDAGTNSQTCSQLYILSFL
jgi:hypothetical protein